MDSAFPCVNRSCADSSDTLRDLRQNLRTQTQGGNSLLTQGTPERSRSSGVLVFEVLGQVDFQSCPAVDPLIENPAFRRAVCAARRDEASFCSQTNRRQTRTLFFSPASASKARHPFVGGGF